MQIKKELAKKMINPYYFTDRALRVGFYITLENHHINHRYKIHPTENIILRKRDPRTHYQVQNETQIRRNQKVTINENNELIFKTYSKNKQQQQPKFELPNCPSCKENDWLEFNKEYYCKNCQHIINKEKPQIDNNVRR